jgi:hypothetical protein
MNFPFFNMNDSRLQAIEKSRELIIEHAERRIELFFYTLVYYYGKKNPIAILDTERGSRQKVHGIKPYYNTHACHSALISNPCEKPLWRRADGSGYINVTIVWPEDNHFINVLSTTTELPMEVNAFDSVLEGKIKTPSFWRQYALDLLNAVNIENTSREKQLIYNYQLEGTFENKWKPNNPTTFNNYCCRLFRLKTNEYDRIQDKEFIQERYKVIENEIFGKRAQPSINLTMSM